MPRFTLQPYGRHHGNSGVTAYVTGADFIVVQFKSGDAYLYTEASAGPEHLAAMQRCATMGKGLSAYISRHTHDRYARQLRVVHGDIVEN